MPLREWPDHLARAAERLLGRVARFSFSRPFLVLGLALVVTLLLAIPARNLALNTDLTGLLPKSFQSVRDATHLSEKFGGVGYVAILVRGKDPAALQRFADEVAPKLERLPTVRFVDHRRPDEFFRNRALYFMDQADLETLRDRLELRRDWEVSRATGVLIDEDETPPPVELADLRKKYDERLELGGAGKKGDEGANGARASPYYFSSDRTELVILVKPAKLASNLGFARQVVSDVERTLAREDMAAYGGDVRFELTGRYKKRVDLQDVLGRDLRIASIVSFVLVLGYIVLHFRRATAVVFVFVPLVVALVLTYGVAGLAIGQLNILTAFIGAILLGIGVDNGIHLLARYDEERFAGKSSADAVFEAFGESGRASAAAALTNVGAFACLMFADFGAFREFGFLAASGLLLTLASYIVLMPAFLGLLVHRREVRAPAPVRRASWARSLVRWAPAIFWGIVVGLTYVGEQLPKAAFNYDFAGLDDANIPSFKLDREINRILGRSQTPLVVLGKDEAEGRAVAAALRDRKKAGGADSTIDRVVTLADLVPQGQAEKQAVLTEIGDIATRLREDKLDEAQRKNRAELIRMAASAPFERGDLPREVRRQFTTQNGQELADFVLVYPAVSMSDGRLAQKVAAEVSGIPVPGGTVSAAGEPMILSDILTSMQRDLPVVLTMALAQQVILLVVLMGSIARAAMTLFPVFVSIPTLIGLLPMFGLELNYLNVILLPTLLGMGEDGAAHLVARTAHGDSIDEALANVAPANFGAGVTTLFGFGALLFAHHPGLQSLGRVAVLGFTVNFIACTVFLPTALEMFRRLREVVRKRGAGATLAATVGLAGLSPRGGGTVGALLAVPAVFAMHSMPMLQRVAIAAGVSVVAYLVTTAYLRLRPGHDPQEIVVDEFAGAFVAMALVPWSPIAALGAFALFRAFDIWKPWPVAFVERNGGGAMGVVGDDVVAGLLAAGVVLGAGIML